MLEALVHGSRFIRIIFRPHGSLLNPCLNQRDLRR